MFALLGLLSLVAGTVARTANPTVTISSGPVVGTISPPNPAPNAAYANAWLGIPYAKPPVGSLRWRPPEEPVPWEEARPAQHLSNACFQQFSGPKPGRDFLERFINTPKLNESENCLYLNVYAPADASPSNTKPVLFFVHGGNLQSGSGSSPSYNGTSFAVNEDVVVVTINYRINVFGFILAPAVPKKDRNLGFLDQRLALEWASTNIKKFGGDPKKITIFGESAGGYSVKQLLANPPDPLPFRAAIMQSQQALFLGKKVKNDYWTVLTHFKCRDLDCLRSVPGEEIKEFIDNYMSRLGAVLSFQPTSGYGTSENDVRPSLRDGSFANVPVMYGTNKNEGSIFAHVRALNKGNEGKRAQPPQQVLVDHHQAPDAEIDAIPVCGDIREEKCFLQWSRYMTGVPFTCPTSELAKFTSKEGYKVWRYRYSPEFPNLRPYEHAGAFHGAELPQVFGTYNATTATKDQIALSAFMQKTWANFAKHPEEGPGWPSLDSGSLADFGSDQNPQSFTLIDQKEANVNCTGWFPDSVALGLAW